MADNVMDLEEIDFENIKDYLKKESPYPDYIEVLGMIDAYLEDYHGYSDSSNEFNWLIFDALVDLRLLVNVKNQGVYCIY